MPTQAAIDYAILRDLQNKLDKCQEETTKIVRQNTQNKRDKNKCIEELKRKKKTANKYLKDLEDCQKNLKKCDGSLMACKQQLSTYNTTVASIDCSHIRSKTGDIKVTTPSGESVTVESRDGTVQVTRPDNSTHIEFSGAREEGHIDQVQEPIDATERSVMNDAPANYGRLGNPLSRIIVSNEDGSLVEVTTANPVVVKQEKSKNKKKKQPKQSLCDKQRQENLEDMQKRQEKRREEKLQSRRHGSHNDVIMDDDLDSILGPRPPPVIEVPLEVDEAPPVVEEVPPEVIFKGEGGEDAPEPCPVVPGDDDVDPGDDDDSYDTVDPRSLRLCQEMHLRYPHLFKNLSERSLVGEPPEPPVLD